MSSGYLHKMEVRKSREIFRAALILAKEFCRYCGASNVCRERRQVMTQLRNEIMALRAEYLKQRVDLENQDLPPPEWFE